MVAVLATHVHRSEFFCLLFLSGIPSPLGKCELVDSGRENTSGKMSPVYFVKINQKVPIFSRIIFLLNAKDFY